MLACEVPPTDEVYCKVMEEEAAFIIKKLRNHASLAVWCGDNENDEALSWVHPFANTLPSYSVITRRVLRDAVIHHDPYRSYIASSPYNTDRAYAQRRMKDKQYFKGEEHLYPPIDNFRKALRDLKSKFLGETGPIQVNAIAMDPAIFAREEARTRRLWDNLALSVNDSREGTIHQTDYYFSKWRQHGKLLCETYFGQDFSLDQWEDYATAVNVMCAEQFKDIIEYCRACRWDKTGVIWWSLMDMWPMLFNYSVVDCNYNPKLPYYWIRQSQQEMLLAGVRKDLDGKLSLYAANDTLTEHTVTYSVTAYNADGSSNVVLMGEHTQKPNSTDLICDLPENGSQMLIIRWEQAGKTCYNHVFTGDVSYPVMAAWLKLLKENCPGYADMQV
jgi:beta-mannosidase